MSTIAQYYSPKCVREFTNAIPLLKTKFGIVHFSNHDSSYGVAGNTFRAYQDWPEPPSKIYRAWAHKICSRLSASTLEHHLRSRDDFLAWHSSLATSLQRHWYRSQDGKLSVAHKYKLIDLMIKWLSKHDFGSHAAVNGFTKHANCAIDRQTLKKLNECISFALPMSNPSMGLVVSENAYAYCQDIIDEFASYCGGSRLLFDYFAWRKGG